MYKGGFQNEPVVLRRGLWPQPKKDFTERFRPKIQAGDALATSATVSRLRNSYG
jgi:hypothetical protein